MPNRTNGRKRASARARLRNETYAPASSKQREESEWMSFAYSLGRISRLNERFHMAVQGRSEALRGARRTSVEFHVILSVLASEGEELSPTQLCDYTLQTPSGMTKTLRRLEEAGLISRFESTDDARFSMVRLTPAGRRLAGHLMEVTLSAYREAFKGVTPRQFSATVKMLRDVRVILETSAG